MDQFKWTLENISEGLESFYSERGRYPTTHEFEAYKMLPSARQIQRRFGGLVELRKTLKLSCPSDFTKGEYSSRRASLINKRAGEKEKEIYELLKAKFGVPFVHREFFFTDDRRTRTDFFIHCKDGNFSVDVFFPKDHHSLINCINSKMRTYGSHLMLEFPVIFLMLNDEISEEEIENLIENKKNKLEEYQRIMTLEEFKDYCETKTPYKTA